MSSQPSTTDKIKDTANSTYESVANTVTSSAEDKSDYDPYKDPKNFDKDAHGNTFKKGDFKDQLNRAATGGLNKGDDQPEGFLEKVKAYVPGLGSEDQPKDDKTPINPGQPPTRPNHDVQVEQFLRKQYHSTAGQGMPDPTKE